MILSDVVTRVADDGNVNSAITTVNSRIIREINRICSELWDGFRWSFRFRNYRIVTDVDYTTGTVTATNGSRTITGVGTTFLSAHKDWHITFNADSILNTYKIRAYTSATQLELDVPYQGTTGSLKTYILRHIDYVLPTEPWDLGNVIVTSNKKPLTMIDPVGLDVLAPTPTWNGGPTAASIYGSDSTPTTYTTGTVSGTISTTTLTGSGTLWLSNVYPGDTVTIGSYNYTVRSVDSDTQIVLYNQQQITSTSATYTITRQFGRILRVMWPSNNNYTLDIRALRKYSPLVNNNDTNELLYRYPNAVILKCAALELKSQNDVRSREIEQQAELAISRAKAEDDALTPKPAFYPIHSYRTYGRNYYEDTII